MPIVLHFHAVFDPPTRQFVVTLTMPDRRFQSRMPPRDFEQFAGNFRGVAEIGGYLVNFDEQDADNPCYGSGDLVTVLSRELEKTPNTVAQLRHYLLKVWEAYRNWCIYKQRDIY